MTHTQHPPPGEKDGVDGAEQLGRTLHHLFLEKRWSRPTPTGLARYEPRDTDVVVTTLGKAGTTLLQQMAYQLAVLSGGAGPDDASGEEFTDIIRVSPWLEFSNEFGIHSYESSPRVFKSAFEAGAFANAGHTLQKHIVVLRDPEAYPASFLNFLFDELVSFKTIPGITGYGERARICADKVVRYHVFHNFVKTELLGIAPDLTKLDKRLTFGTHSEAEAVDLAKLRSLYGKFDWFRFAKGWLKARAEDRSAENERVLVLFYEDTVNDLRKTAALVANFMGVSLPEGSAVLDTVVERCKREYMVGNPKFECQIEAESFGIGKVLKCNPESFVGFKQFSFDKDELNVLRERFQETFGVDSYNEFKSRVNAHTL